MPRGFADRNPGANVIPQGDWDGAQRPDWLDPSSDMYQQVSASFYRHQQELFGTLPARAIDLQHEGGQLGGVSLSAAAAGVQRALVAADPSYLWVIQGWLTNPQQAVIDAVDKSHMLVLDLDHSGWTSKQAFWGAPWAWGELGNFGGRLGLFGHMHQIAHDLPAALRSPDRGALIGLAMTKEGLDQDPIVEQLISDMVWRSDDVDLDSWVRDYVVARYGVADPDAIAAWRSLVGTAYSVTDARRADSILNAQPSLTATTSAPRSSSRLPYDPAVVESAWHRLLAAASRLGKVDTYRYDLADVTRQVIVNRARVVLPQVNAAYTAGDEPAFKQQSTAFLHLADLEESVLRTRPEFLFGPWVADARSWGQTPAESDMLARDAKQLLTYWGEPASLAASNRDYANRDWSGLISGYYQPRWVRYFSSLDSALLTGTTPQPIDWYAVGQAFAASSDQYPVAPQGDTVRAARLVAAELPAAG